MPTLAKRSPIVPAARTRPGRARGPSAHARRAWGAAGCVGRAKRGAEAPRAAHAPGPSSHAVIPLPSCAMCSQTRSSSFLRSFVRWAPLWQLRLPQVARGCTAARRPAQRRTGALSAAGERPAGALSAAPALARPTRGAVHCMMPLLGRAHGSSGGKDAARGVAEAALSGSRELIGTSTSGRCAHLAGLTVPARLAASRRPRLAGKHARRVACMRTRRDGAAHAAYCAAALQDAATKRIRWLRAHVPRARCAQRPARRVPHTRPRCARRCVGVLHPILPPWGTC